jgi:hypothetical protein
MPKSKSNCPFCDSARHKACDCAFHFDGKRDLLEKCMLMTEMPNFDSYTKKELKFIAFITPHKNTTLRIMGPEEYEYDPVPLTLCKSKMEKALQVRWEALQSAKNHTKQVTCTNYCYICCERGYETHNWSIETGDWIRSESARKYDPKTTIECGHTFCTHCWNNIPSYCSHYEYLDKDEYPEAVGFPFEHNKIQAHVHYQYCPGCNTRVYIEKWYARARRDRPTSRDQQARIRPLLPQTVPARVVTGQYW